ncbi:hypothetical protein JCM11491_004701 [Sporobolomyces phaffii]
MDSAPVPNRAFAGTACFACFQPAERLQKCSSCRIVRYCSQACAAKDWKDHKSFCRSIHAIRSTVDPPDPVVLVQGDDEPQWWTKRRDVQRKVWLTEDELLETALKRQPTMLESKLLWREPRCAICSDRECDVEQRPPPPRATTTSTSTTDSANQNGGGWTVCRACHVVAFCSRKHEQSAHETHRLIKDVDGRTQCEAVQLSNEIDEFFLRQHLASAASSSSSTPSLWVPNRIVRASTARARPASWPEYLASVTEYLPTPNPPLAEIYGVFVEALSPVLTILASLDRLVDSYPDDDGRFTLYLVDESLETCSNWIPCLEELQHQVAALRHVAIVTVSPTVSQPQSQSQAGGANQKTTQRSSVTQLPMCPACTREGRTRTITHVEHLPAAPTLRAARSKALAVSFNSSLALADASGTGTSFWAQTLETISTPGYGVPFLVTSQTRDEAGDALDVLSTGGGGGGCAWDRECGWTLERNAWRGGWGRVEGWWDGDGEGIVWKNGWTSLVVAKKKRAD